MDFRVSWVLGLLLAGACYHSHSSPAGETSDDAGAQDASTLDTIALDASVQDSATGEDASRCRGPVDWRIDVPLAVFTHASATSDGWRISGVGAAPANASTGWTANANGSLSEATGLVDTPWGSASGEIAGGDVDGTIHIARFDESGEAVWRGEHTHGQVMRTLEVIEDGSATYIVGTLMTTEGDRDTLVARFDDIGALEWVQIFGERADSEPSSNEWVVGAFMDARGRLVVVNHLHLLGGEVHGPVPVWVFALTSGGEVAWEHFEDGYDGVSRWGLTHDDLGMFLVGTLAHFDIRGALQTVRLDIDGERLWTTRVDDRSERRHNVSAALRTPDGGYLLAGRMNDGELAGGGRIWKLDSAGELLWTTTPGDLRGNISHMAPFEGGYILKAHLHMNERTWWAFLGIGQDGEVRWRHNEEMRATSATVLTMVPNGRGEVLAVGHSTEGGVRGATAVQFGQRCR